MGRAIQVSKPAMKTIRVALLTFFALIDLSWQARPPSQSLYAPPSSPHRPHPSPPSSPPGHHQPSCRQVPKEVCKQVPRQTYESVTRQQCRDVPDQVCTQAQEKKCSIQQRPVQEYSNQKVCSIHYRKECEDAKDIKKQCTQVQDEECYSTAKLQCVSFPRTSKKPSMKR